MLKFIPLSRSRQQAFVGGAVLALSLIWSSLGGAQNEPAHPGGDDKPQAQHQAKRRAGGQGTGSQMPGMKMPDMSGEKHDSAWWFDNYTRGQKQAAGGQDMAHGEGGMPGMAGMTKGNVDAGSMAGDASSSSKGMASDVDLMGMLEDDMGLLGARAVGVVGSMNMKGIGEMKTASSTPGIPGVSQLYHIGATGFFLNQSGHIALTTKQRAALNRTKQKAALRKFTSQRRIEEAEQELWELTGGDELNAARVQAAVQAIANLRSEQRIAFIQSVGEAAKVLTDEQHQILLGTMQTDASGASDH